MLKLYPAQINTQAAIEATLGLYRNGLAAACENSSSMATATSAAASRVRPKPLTPSSREAADHSTPYVMAMALLRGRLTPASMKHHLGKPPR